MFAEHVDPPGKALLRGILIKMGRVRPREAKEFAQGHTALQHSQVPLTLEPHPPGTVPKGQGCQLPAEALPQTGWASSCRLGCRLQMESFSSKPFSSLLVLPQRCEPPARGVMGELTTGVWRP